MKFVSKNLNLGVTLRSGIQANPIAGIGGTPGLYARFQDGLFESNDPDVIARMQRHPGYNSDFVSVEDPENERYNAHENSMSEPEHDHIEIEYGHVGKSRNPAPPVKLTPELKKYLAQVAAKMATEMLVKMSEDAAKKQEDKKSDDGEGSVGQVDTVMAKPEDPKKTKAKA